MLETVTVFRRCIQIELIHRGVEKSALSDHVYLERTAWTFVSNAGAVDT